nr:hypothetical protein [Tanacetum cinerariifolium]
MDLCGPMSVKSVNRKKYILVIVYDYSRFTWVKCLRSKDEAPDFIIKFLKMIQIRLKVGISHETSVARSSQQNGVVERHNRTLIEAARTIENLGKLQPKANIEIFIGYAPTKKAFQIYNRHTKRIVETIHFDFDELTAMDSEQSSSGPALHEMTPAAISSGLVPKPTSPTPFVPPYTPYEILHDKLPDLSFLHVFGALSYPTNDSENLGKLQPKANIEIFIGYAPTKKAFQIYNRHTKRIVETIHFDFDELTAMDSEQSSSGPALHEMTPAAISSGLVPKPTSPTPFVPPSRNDWDLLFQQLFDELLTPPPSVDPPAPEVITPIDEVVASEFAESTDSPSSTTVDQDAPSPSKSQTTPETQPHVIHHNVEEDNHDIGVAHIGNDPLFGIPIPEVTSYQSSSTDFTHEIVDPDHQISQHKWTKDHPLENTIG